MSSSAVFEVMVTLRSNMCLCGQYLCKTDEDPDLYSQDFDPWTDDAQVREMLSFEA